eukprot:TRINITY_DN18307_c0_g1_i1.p1 TRINITY_DN18307_c0_g1~~TRINITY_DN18307_c0_g1_i1.p1  ORF type:complete len:440 (+),score=143.87 TRINITY_DN18307_c0_g1_i1:84-1403(+)
MFETWPLWVKQAVVITGMLTFGTCTVVLQKVIFSMHTKDDPDHKFEKPWFQTEVMFVGMFGCLAVYEIMELVKFFQLRKMAPEQRALLAIKHTSVDPTKKPPMPKWKQYIVCFVPAMCDLSATAAMNIGLVWISASVWQMLRGSMVVFSALFSWLFLKKKLYVYHWLGVGIVVFALCVVAFSSLMPVCETCKSSSSSFSSMMFFNESSSSSSGSSSSESSSSSETSSFSSSSTGSEEVTMTEEISGILLVVFAQVIQASQIVIEQHLLENVDLNPILIVGLEGFWGGIACSGVLFIVYWIPADPPISEDTIDSFQMIFNDWSLALTICAYAAAILCYNMFGMLVTKVTGAVIRTILEGMRTLCIWVCDLFIYYVIGNPDFGEKWTEWSYLQMCGFLFLLLGMLVYNGIIRIDGITYPPPAVPAPKADLINDDASDTPRD